MNRQSQRIIAGILLIMMGVLLLTPSTYALKLRKERRVKNNWSFQVMSDNRIDQENYEGVRFALKKRLSKTTSLRFTLGFVERNDHLVNQMIRSDKMDIVFSNHPDFDLEAANFSFQYLFSSSNNRRTNFYWGMGPYVSVEKTTPDEIIISRDYYPYIDYSEVYIGESALIGVGAEWSFGMEWFLGRNFSFIGEYGLTIQNRWHVVELEHYDAFGHWHTDSESVNDGVHVDASRIKLGLAVHF